MKRKLESQLQPASSSAESDDNQPLRFLFAKKQLRSRLSPIVTFPAEEEEVSCDSSILTNNNNPHHPVAATRNDAFQRVVTRSYYKKLFANSVEEAAAASDLLSENSCVESTTNTDLKLLTCPLPAESEGENTNKSDVSYASSYSHFHDICKPKHDQYSVEIHDENEAESEEIQLPIDLACSEQFSNGAHLLNEDEVESEDEHNSSSSGIFRVILESEFESSEYTPSIWSYESGSQFSDGDESVSPTFGLLNEFRMHFCRSTFACVVGTGDHTSRHEIAVLGLEDEEDEESYRMMRERERRQAYVHDYAEEYCSKTEYGDLIIQQRLHMVHWIVEQANNKELQKETMFLGVGLLDRFLSKGYFKTKRNLQIAGIACLTLATRIEENQPYNCVRRRTFCVDSTTYTRSEVVAMEWLVQETLSFRCFLPTLYNFLWFYFKAAKADVKVEKTAKYLALLTLIGHQHLCYWPSTVAAAIVILASLAENEDASSQFVRDIYSRVNDKDLPECIKSLEWLTKYL